MDSHKLKVKQFNLEHAAVSLTITAVARTHYQMTIKKARKLISQLDCDGCITSIEDMIDDMQKEIHQLDEDIKEGIDTIREISLW